MMNAQHDMPVCCQKAEGHLAPAEYQFHSLVTLLNPSEIDKTMQDHNMSESGKTSPLDFLATLAFQQDNDSPSLSYWATSPSEGKERATVVSGPSGTPIRLHKGNGRLPPVDLSKPFAKKCRNRECNNLCGQIGKPRSIYCSKRCQSREQNLRQGRIKNVRSPTPTNTGGIRRSGSPRSSPSPVSMLAQSPSPAPSPSPNVMASPSPIGTRVGMTPSPIPMTGTFSPIPMSSNLPPSSHIQTPILLPRPTAVSPTNTAAANNGVFKPSPKPGPSLGATNIQSSFQPSQQKKMLNTDALSSMENLTLAPILSST